MTHPNEPAGLERWPNQEPVPDGVQDVSQDPALFADEDEEGA